MGRLFGPFHVARMRSLSARRPSSDSLPALMRSSTLLALALLLSLPAGACATRPVRLYELRAAEVGSRDQLAYSRLEGAVAIANRFLAESEAARDAPAGRSSFEIGRSDLIVHLAEAGTQPLRIETAGWGDSRTLFGDRVHGTSSGFLAAHDNSASAEDASDNLFFLLSPEDMAATLLRQALIMHEIRVRGELGYWLNYDLLGLDPTIGWWRGATVDARANALEDAYYLWLRSRP